MLRRSQSNLIASHCRYAKRVVTMRLEDTQTFVRDLPLTFKFKRLLCIKPLQFWARLALGAIFIAASIDKIHHPAAFAQMLFNYHILPASLINPTAILLPWLELILGLLLVAGYWLPGAVTLANILLLTFFGALLANKVRGVDVPCGCFDTNAQAPPATSWYLLRDAGFILLGGYLFYAEIIRRKGTVSSRK